ncbi:otopetrin [Anopheles darlingi]|uniref:Otopetrin n=1 Tax=Anopheles darlingi TaxID=43151 RepID=W5JWD4_ANODA|nr:otopetrin [Anopheles darlingi]
MTTTMIIICHHLTSDRRVAGGDEGEWDLEATLQPIMQPMPSPSVPQNAIVSPESFSTHTTSPVPSLQAQPLAESSQQQHEQQQDQLDLSQPISMPPAMMTIVTDYPTYAGGVGVVVGGLTTGVDGTGPLRGLPSKASTSSSSTSSASASSSSSAPPPLSGSCSASSSTGVVPRQLTLLTTSSSPKGAGGSGRGTAVINRGDQQLHSVELGDGPSAPAGQSGPRCYSPKSLSQTPPVSGGAAGGAGETATGTTTQHHLSVLYHAHHHHLHPILTTNRRPSRLPEPVYYPAPREVKPGEALATTLSALYGKLLVVMGIAFPMAEVISTYIPPSFYEVRKVQHRNSSSSSSSSSSTSQLGFYLYLYIGSMLFLFFMYTTLLWGKPKTPANSPVKKPVSGSAAATTAMAKKVLHRTSTPCSTDSGERSDSEDETLSSGPKMVQARRMSLSASATSRLQHFGSFYLRMGAVAFGIGSMIYSGLEFGQYFELERDTKCHNVLLALTPATRMAFIFIQMYFIFLNNEVRASQIKVYRHKIVARFGLMHMIGTNLSVWFSVLIQETKHEILTFYNPENRTLRISHRLGNKMMPPPPVVAESVAHLRVARGLKGPHNIFECRRSNIIGTLVQDASPFLFPCTIEYSLICAAILYVMWRSISRPQTAADQPQRQESVHPLHKRSPHHYSVDCAGAHKGLFIGILILVLTIISLILFFVLISRPEFVNLAVTEVNICELTLYGTTTAATLIGMFQVRHMQYDAFRSFSLDDILLVGGQTGSFLYSTFTVIGGHFTMRRDTVLVLITALASLVETACQTMFILDASRRSAATQEHIRKKPGREIVTFLLVSNLAMWAINTLEKSRAESHPIQLHFYGLWAWTIITHVSMPLAIFYRFHSTVCLCEIWKRAYKMKPAYM